MKKIANNIETRIDAVVRDNKEYICGMTVADYLLCSLNQDGDYWWYIEDDNDDQLTDADREMVEEFIKENYSLKLTINLDTMHIYAYNYYANEPDADLDIAMQDYIDELYPGKYEVYPAEYYEEDDCWSAKIVELI